MREIKKIIWATDGSKKSEEALNYAVFLAKKFGSEIFGIHVIPTPEKLLYETEFQNWTIKVEENIQSKLTLIANELSSQGINFQGVVLKGEPNKEIVEFARREKADLLAIGKKGLGLIDRILIGSTTLRVLRESNIPVLAVKKRDEEGTINTRNILVPLDIYEEVESSLNYAIDLAERISVNISVVYVFALGAFFDEVSFSVLEDLINISSNKLAKRVGEIKLKRESKLEINTEVIMGISLSTAIVDYASNKNADLIVINTHGRKGVRRLILGSVTEKVIQESTCAVLALKP
jgi:nucleotide-binding universal stress UspA family protein